MKKLNKKKIIKDFLFCKNKEEKLLYLIKIGKNIPLKKTDIRQKDNIIHGCQSNVWLKINITKNLVNINADSNSRIIKGILLLIIILLNKKNIKKAKKTNINKFFKKIKILHYLSFTRTIGIKIILKIIKSKLSKNI